MAGTGLTNDGTGTQLGLGAPCQGMGGRHP